VFSMVPNLLLMRGLIYKRAYLTWLLTNLTFSIEPTMEPVSLAVGVLSLVGISNDLLQFIAYVVVARYSSEQHVDCKLRLRAAALRFAR